MVHIFNPRINKVIIIIIIFIISSSSSSSSNSNSISSTVLVIIIYVKLKIKTTIMKKVFLEILQNSQKNTCVGVLFLIFIPLVPGGNKRSHVLKKSVERDSDTGIFLRNFTLRRILFLYTFGGCFWMGGE